MQAGDLLVEVLGQDVDLLLVALVVDEELDLGHGLVGEGVAHHEARVAGRVAEVEQPSLGEHDDRAPARQGPLVDLGLDRLARDARAGSARPAMSISLSKWPMLPSTARCFIACMCSTVTMSRLPVAVMTKSAIGEGLVERRHLEAVHRRLQRADRIDLGDDDPRALAAQRLGRALADVAVAADDGDLAADEDVGRAIDARRSASGARRTCCRTWTW